MIPRRLKALGLTMVAVAGRASEAGTITPLSSPGEFSPAATVIDFDDFPADTCTNNLYTGLGIEFSRDDGQPIPIFDWEALDRVTTSPPNVIATVLGMTECGPANPWTSHLNITFDEPTLEIGAFFGNDQEPAFSQTTLSVFDANDNPLGSVVVLTNNNTDVDQFIGLRSDVPFFRARFENNYSHYAVDLDDVIFSMQQCLTVTSQEVLCHADGTTFTVNVEGFSRCDGGPIQLSLTASGGAVGEELCFTTIIDDGGFCCSTEICVTVPDCSSPAHACDFDGDGLVGITDLVALLAAWGPCADCADCPADMDGDCAVGIADLLILLADWGS